MAYFNNAFKKTIVLSDYLPAGGGGVTTTAALTSGQMAMFNAHDWQVAAIDECCQFILATGSPYQSDKIGSHHGGYQASIKTKGINPRYVTKMWTQNAHVAQNAILHIGKTPYTQTAGTADCCPTFLCGENYHLRIDIKGSPALRMLNHQAYGEVTAYTGCCADATVAPVAVNPAIVMLGWQEQILDNPILMGGLNNQESPFEGAFIIPVVTVSAAGAAGVIGDGATLVYPAGTPAAVLTAGVTATNTHLGLVGPATVIATTADAYTPAAYTDECAGLTLVGAFVETTFGDCTFQPSDFYGVEPIRLYASEVDLNGDPCEFTGVCIVDECKGYQAEGLGETVARDFILSESYRQIPFATDLRIREITQGNDMLGAGAGQVDRTALYDHLYILHTVPRFNNPSGTFDNDQYLIDIVSLSTVAGKAERDALLTDLQNKIGTCGHLDCMAEMTPLGACPANPSIIVTA